MAIVYYDYFSVSIVEKLYEKNIIYKIYLVSKLESLFYLIMGIKT